MLLTNEILNHLRDTCEPAPALSIGNLSSFISVGDIVLTHSACYGGTFVGVVFEVRKGLFKFRIVCCGQNSEHMYKTAYGDYGDLIGKLNWGN